MSARRGSPRIERLPSARGPHSMRPWNQPTTSPSAMRGGGLPAELVLVVDPLGPCSPRPRARRDGASISALDAPSPKAGPQVGVLHHEAARAAERPRARRQRRRRSRRRRRPPPPGRRGRGTACARRSCRWRPSSWRSRPARHSAGSPVRRCTLFEQVEEGLLVHRLQRGGEVLVPLRRLGVRARAAARAARTRASVKIRPTVGAPSSQTISTPSAWWRK